MYIPLSLQNILKSLIKNDAKPYLVGGIVRDYLFDTSKNKSININNKSDFDSDYDIEVYDISLDNLEKLLSNFGAVHLVGKSFGILKLHIDDIDLDFSLPRTENKISAGHSGFEVTTNPNLTLKEASKRRDFTCNAIMYDFQSDTFIDNFDGIKDIENRLLRYVDENSFIEDPLRVYRAVQFCARFGFEIEEQTFSLCKSLIPNLVELPKERVWEEFKKLLLKSSLSKPQPSIGLNLMKKLGILEPYFPELHSIIGIEQDPNHHAEGDVWTHTLRVVDEMAILSQGFEEKRRLILLLSALCHDLGKSKTTTNIDGKITSYGHEDESIPLTSSFLSRLSDDKELINHILPLVKYHYAPSSLFKQKSKKSAIRRLTVKLGVAKLEDLIILAKADYFGRDTTYDRSDIFEAEKWILEIAKTQNIMQNAPKQIVQGRDLIELGMKPSPRFKEILNQAYELQIEDETLTKDEIIKKLDF